jgi:hypothetical protein
MRPGKTSSSPAASEATHLQFPCRSTASVSDSAALQCRRCANKAPMSLVQRLSVGSRNGSQRIACGRLSRRVEVDRKHESGKAALCSWFVLDVLAS